MYRPILAVISALLFGTHTLLVPVYADEQHEQHEQHSDSPLQVYSVNATDDHPSVKENEAMITEPSLAGQYAFATIAEIVNLLERDPTTDWTKVDLERLRLHLIDMDRVTLGADVQQVDIPGGARFLITSKNLDVKSSIDRMTRAHVATLHQSNEEPVVGTASWHYSLETLPTGVAFTVTGDDAMAARRIRAYGFIGVLVAGSHHPRHHLALARGEDPHTH